jgi:hypothetical protein
MAADANTTSAGSLGRNSRLLSVEQEKRYAAPRVAINFCAA